MTAIPNNFLFLKEGETLIVEPGGMLAMRNCAMKTHLASGTLLERFKSYALGGELLWRNSFTALAGGGWIALEEQMPGQIRSEELSLDKPAMMIRNRAYLASTENVRLETQYLGLQGYFRGTGISAIRASVQEGNGKIFFHANGTGVQEIAVRPQDGPVIVDNEMILAYSENLQCQLKNPGASTSSFFFSGEGLVCEFQGEGKVYVASGTQTGQDNFIDTAMNEAAKRITQLAIGAATCTGLVYVFHYYTGINPVAYLAKKIAQHYFRKISFF